MTKGVFLQQGTTPFCVCSLFQLIIACDVALGAIKRCNAYLLTLLDIDVILHAAIVRVVSRIRTLVEEYH